MSNALKIVLMILFESYRPIYIAFRILYMIGVWKVLEKSGEKGWKALIPWVREYTLACCAQREPEGRIYCLVNFGIVMFNVLSILTGMMESAGEVIVALFGLLGIVLYIIEVIYAARIFSGLCENYRQKKIWTLLWMFSIVECIPALLWGFSDKYQPTWKMEDLKAEMQRLATHGKAATMKEGLTVNLEERSVVEFFHKKLLLRDIHLSIPQGHMVLLLGGSGAGKTTFVNAVNGYEQAKAEVLLNGVNLYTHYDKMKYDIGFVPQGDTMRGKDTVVATLMDAAKLRLPMDVDYYQRKARVEEVMDIFGLKPVQDNLVEKLSGGQRKRLSIAMEFLSNPSLFILDEPDSGLDGVMAREIFQQLRRIADTGKIVIAISHTPDRVIDLFDDVIVLAKDSTRTGRLAWYGSIDGARKFFDRERMEQIVKSVNQKSEGGDGLADEFVMRYAEVQNA